VFGVTIFSIKNEAGRMKPSEITAFHLTVTICLAIGTLFSREVQADEPDWSQSVELPAGEVRSRLFDGQTLEGWQGLKDAYWSVEDGAIVGRNEQPVPASTYLFTKKSYRDFRLLMEVKQTIGPDFSTMHSAVCCLGEIIEDNGQAFGFRGPLLMFCHDWGIWDAHRRNRIYPADHPGTYHPQVGGAAVEQTGDWNQIEVLVTGNRIQMVAGGTQVIDMTDKAEMLRASPIGLQLHSNQRPQEFRFRGLVIVENPTATLVTLKTK
jgi:Domain of Unknown Function (DUF1080)